MINWLRKKHFLHDWGHWSSPIFRFTSGMTNDYYYQERFCLTCNKAQKIKRKNI